MLPTANRRLLWIDPDDFDPLSWPLISLRYQVQAAPVREALAMLASQSPDVIVLHFSAAARPAADFLRTIQRLTPATPIFGYAPDLPISEAVYLSRLGVSQFFSGDDEAVALFASAGKYSGTSSFMHLAAQTSREDWEGLLIGDSHEMRQICHIIRVVGARRATVLITGETGTGKEMAARAIHLASPRRRGPWVAVNCSALPENLLEAELFGHVRGAFTGAIQNRAGRFEEAQGGTLFLDEIGDLALGLQAKLLRVVQERELQRLGSSETVRLDVRLVAATNCGLAERVAQGRFREDLYYRLNVVPLQMPPLRSRPCDIERLALHFVQKICRAENLPQRTLAPEALARLTDYPWPGNVRQLENAVEMAVALTGERLLLDARDFSLPPPVSASRGAPTVPTVALPDQGMDYEETLAEIERSILQQALQKTGGNKKAAADMLRLKRTTLSAKVRSLAPLALCN